MKISPNLRVFITGKTQSGKSFFAKKLISSFSNRIIYDIKREYGHLGAIVHTLPQFVNALKSGCTSLVIQPDNLESDYFNLFCEYIFKHLKNILFVVDEVQLLVQKMYIPSWFKSIITVGQGDGFKIGVICITQRAANVHNDIISQSSIIVCFRLNLECDAKAVYNFTQINPSEIQNLKPYHFIVYNEKELVPIRKYLPIS